MKSVIILANIENIDKNILKNCYIVGADKGAYIAAKNNIELDVSIGDFDSCNQEEFKLIESHSKKIIRLNPIKDETDTKEAINLCKNFDEILILGGIKGKRIEHFIANLIELYNNPKIKMLDDNSLIETKENITFTPNEDYKYISFFSLSNDTKLTLNGFKYNLNSYTLKANDPLCISNELENNPIVKVEGKVLVIYSLEDH